MKREMVRLGGGAFALTFTLAFAASVLDGPPHVARAEAIVPPSSAEIPMIAMAALPAPAPVRAELRLAPASPARLAPPTEPPDELADELALEAALEGPWTPPPWYPDATRAELWVLEGVDGAVVDQARQPLVRSRSAFVYDMDSGDVLYARNADERRPVASLTKVVSSLAAMAEGADLSREICIDPAQWPGWPGAHSYLNTGTCLQGWDLIGAALVASDNRAAFALAPLSGLPFAPFVARMNEVALELGMGLSDFADPAGVDDENLSTARDMTRAVVAASLHPVLGPVASAPSWDIEETRRERSRRLFSTNRMAGSQKLEFLAAKTGYTDTARYCFTAVVRTEDGRRVALTVLGAPNNRTRWADVGRLLDWVETLPG